jgi:hypothetical protein
MRIPRIIPCIPNQSAQWETLLEDKRKHTSQVAPTVGLSERPGVLPVEWFIFSFDGFSNPRVFNTPMPPIQVSQQVFLPAHNQQATTPRHYLAHLTISLFINGRGSGGFIFKWTTAQSGYNAPVMRDCPPSFLLWILTTSIRGRVF